MPVIITRPNCREGGGWGLVRETPGRGLRSGVSRTRPRPPDSCRIRAEINTFILGQQSHRWRRTRATPGYAAAAALASPRVARGDFRSRRRRREQESASARPRPRGAAFPMVAAAATGRSGRGGPGPDCGLLWRRARPPGPRSSGFRSDEGGDEQEHDQHARAPRGAPWRGPTAARAASSQVGLERLPMLDEHGLLRREQLPLPLLDRLLLRGLGDRRARGPSGRLLGWGSPRGWAGRQGRAWKDQSQLRGWSPSSAPPARLSSHG